MRLKGELRDGYKKDTEVQHLRAQLKAKEAEATTERTTLLNKLKHCQRKRQLHDEEVRHTQEGLGREVKTLLASNEMLQRENDALHAQLHPSLRNSRKNSSQLQPSTIPIPVSRL